MMNCDQFEKYELGELDEEMFNRHLEKCASCQKTVDEDARLMNLTQTLKKPIEAPGLWDRIERDLESEIKQAEQPRILRFQHRVIPVLRMAAVLVIMVLAGRYLLFKPKEAPSKLLAQTALEKVERQEAAYMKAIDALAKTVQPKLADMDVELALLYRDRLETIDDQIAQCREALEQNPANAHIRRYMLAALQDKKETLREILRS